VVPSKGYHFADAPYVEYIVSEEGGGLTEAEIRDMPALLSASMAEIVAQAIETRVRLQTKESAEGSGGDAFVRIVEVLFRSTPLLSSFFLHTSFPLSIPLFSSPYYNIHIYIFYLLCVGTNRWRGWIVRVEART